MSVFDTKLYMQHLLSLLWFLLTILSVLSLTAFPLISVGSQISAALSFYKHLASKWIFFTRVSRCPMWCKSGRTYVRHKISKIDRPNRKLFFQKNRLLFKMMSKNQVNRRNIFTKKHALFLKSINNILKRNQSNYQHYINIRRVTRNFSGQGRFLKIRAFR